MAPIRSILVLGSSLLSGSPVHASSASEVSAEGQCRTRGCAAPGTDRLAALRMAAPVDDSDLAGLKLLQRESATRRSGSHDSPSAGEPVESTDATGTGSQGRDLVLQHIPYNFGHTIEKVAAVGTGMSVLDSYGKLLMMEEAHSLPLDARWTLTKRVLRPNSEVWSHLNPDLDVVSEVTGCPMYYTPGKYWPKDMADKYFGNKTVFGMLRDPYERLVSMFRGNFGSYGGAYPKFFHQCDVNGAVRKMMEDYLAGDIYSGDCTFVPQAEYFDGPYGVTLAVDNRRFPDSMNEVFAKNGYTDFHIESSDILHVGGCPNVWAGDLDCETKAMVKKVYARDFELLCSKFGYCEEENTCIHGVAEMCPSNLEEKRQNATHCS